MREFRSFTHELIELADWLEACGIETVAMESTGVYWIPLYEILEQRGFEVLLVNARHVKGVPGRKSDVIDCQWIQQLHTFGLLRGSFRPDAPVAAIRSLVRHRDQLVDPSVLARHRHPRCKASESEIAASLTGHYRDEHLFVLRQALELYDSYQEKICSCDDQIEVHIQVLEASCESPRTPLPKPRKTRKRSSNEPHFEIRSPLFALCGGSISPSYRGSGPTARSSSSPRLVST